MLETYYYEDSNKTNFFSTSFNGAIVLNYLWITILHLRSFELKSFFPRVAVLARLGWSVGNEDGGGNLLYQPSRDDRSAKMFMS